MSEPTTTAIRLRFADAPESLAEIVSAIADAGGTLRTRPVRPRPPARPPLLTLAFRELVLC